MNYDSFPEIVLRLMAAAATGAVLGIDRDLHHKPAGLRVLSLVSLGSAVTMVFSLELGGLTSPNSHDQYLRAVQGILSGIGFLGAGVILRSDRGNEVHGLTTAASVWVSSILGMAVGLGQWALGTVSIVLVVLILVGGRRVETILKQWHQPLQAEASPPAPTDSPHTPTDSLPTSSPGTAAARSAESVSRDDDRPARPARSLGDSDKLG